MALFVGLGMGLIYAGVFAVQWLLAFKGGEALDMKHPLLLMLVYLLAGGLGGGLVGALGGLTRSWIGAAAAGFVVALPVSCLLAIAGEPVGGWQSSRFDVAVGTAVALGPAIGIALRFAFRMQDKWLS